MFVRLSVAERLVVASQTLPDDFRLLIIEGYRPLAVQQEYFRQHMATLRNAHPEIEEEALIDLTSRWVAPPAVGAHPTGAAIDLTLQYRDGSHIDMGSVVNATDAESSGSCYQLVAGFTLAQVEGSEAMWRERAEAVRVLKRSDRYAIFSGSLSG